MRPLIIHTITKLELGGAQQNTLFTLEHLDDRFRGILICGRGGYLDKKAELSGKFIVRFCPFMDRQINPILDLLAFIWLYFYLLPYNCAVLHSHSSKAGILSRFAAFLAGVPVIMHTFHGFGFTPLQKRIIFRTFVYLEKVAASVSDCLIAVAEENIRQAVSLGIGKEEKFVMIRSGIDFNKFEKVHEKYIIKKKFGILPETRVVGNISCFKPQKGLSEFIKTADILDKTGDYRFIIIGDGILRHQLEREIASRGLSERFILTGWREDIEDILPVFDVMLHTAFFEGLPRVFFEAMAAGVPVVATSVDGAKDVIVHGYNGYLINGRSVEEMAMYVSDLAGDTEKRAVFSANMKKSRKYGYDIKEMSEILNRLYANIYLKNSISIN